MKTVSALYNQILAIEGHRTTYKCSIQNNEGTYIDYTGANLISIKISSSLFSEDKFSIGGTCSAELDMELIPTTDTIKRRARIKLYARLESGSLVSEWVPQGVFYIYQRKLNNDGYLEIKAYDCMLMAEDFMYSTDETITTKAMSAMVAEICTKLQSYGSNITLETGTTISSTFACQVDTTMTIREYLKYIAVAHAGNWTVTVDSNCNEILRLYRFDSEADDLLGTENNETLTIGGDAFYV